jgi:bacterioferritin
MGTKGTQIVELDVPDLIADLNRAYADEWLAVYAYTHMAQVATGRPGAMYLVKLLEDTAKDELEHQDELAGRIAQLGGKPLADVSRLVETSNAGYPTPPTNEKDFEAMVKTVIEAERGAIEVYNKLAHKIHGKDPITYELIVHILGEEVEHETEFEMLLG